MKSRNDFRPRRHPALANGKAARGSLSQALLASDEVIACADHVDFVRSIQRTILYSEENLRDEELTGLDEVARCGTCHLMAAIVTRAFARLETQPDHAPPRSAEDDADPTTTETPVEPHSLEGREPVDAQQAIMEDDTQPKAAHDVDQPELPFVKTLSVVDTFRVEMLIRNTPSAVDVTNIFVPEAKDRDMNPRDATCITGVFHSRQGKARLPSFAVDELCYIHLCGHMVLEFEGAEPVTLDANDAIQVLWLPGNATTRNRIPPASVVCETGWVAGLIVFMREAGLHWTGPDTHDRVFLDGMDRKSWSPEHMSEYWRSVASRFPGQINEQRPFVGGISLSEASLNETFHALRISNQGGDPHRDARDAGQIDYAGLPGWPTRQRPIFDFRLLRFSSIFSKAGKGEVWLAKHTNGYEILIPLVGEFRGVGGEVEPEKLSDHDMSAFRPVDEGIDLRWFTERHVKAPAISGRLLPNYMAVCSDAVFHGFTALGGRDAYVLHIRVGRAIAPRSGKLGERTVLTRRLATGDRQ